MLVKVFKLGSEGDAVTVFPVGTHVLGRGPTLQCNDKRVSRSHAIIEVTQNDVKITSIHINPCFLKMANSKTVTILSKDSTSQLGDGDNFSLLPDSMWFKIKIVEGDDGTKEPTPKRHLSESGEDAPDKRTKLDPETNISGSGEPESKTVEQAEEAPKAASSADEPEVTNSVQIKQENLEDGTVCDSTNVSSTSMLPENEVAVNGAIKEEPPDNDGLNPNTSGKDVTSSVEIKVEQPDSEGNDGLNPGTSGKDVISSEEIKAEQPGNGDDGGSSPGTSNPQPKRFRERCWYAAECYRKHPGHRDEYKHPGDSDFESDPEDKRPTCSFGATCYRKNKIHRRDFKHPPGKPPSQAKKKRARKQVVRTGVVDYDDLSDSEDPFAADGDSDDYEQDSDDDDDTDWEDSQNVDEDSENMKRLVKEAKRFTKK